jgi:hypothetical protein
MIVFGYVYFLKYVESFFISFCFLFVSVCEIEI